MEVSAGRDAQASGVVWDSWALPTRLHHPAPPFLHPAPPGHRGPSLGVQFHQRSVTLT